LCVTVRDWGSGELPPPPPIEPDPARPGGLGLVCLGKLMDEVRFDRQPDGSLMVLDYKSGRKDSLTPKLKPEVLLAPEFQLALYVEMLRRREPGTRVDAAYLSLRDAQRTRSLRASGIDLEALPIAQAVEERVARMRAGRFEARPLSCDHCPLEPACRLVALPTDPEENGGEVPRA